MNNIVQLDDFYFVSPQIKVEDLHVLKQQGFTKIINNRPEGESEGQPLGEDIKILAEQLGLEYIANPIVLSALSDVNVACQKSSLCEGQKTLAFCRTGTRSSVLWILLNNSRGESYDELVSSVTQKGFDLTRCLGAMEPLAHR